MSNLITQATFDKLFEEMSTDYDKFIDNAEMRKHYRETLRVSIGNKYIKVIHDNSVAFFIVNTHNDKKFKYGDLLLPAGFSTPARNKARGNIFTGYAVKWTGVHYLR